MNPVIETNDLSKEYSSNKFSGQKVKALNHFTFTVNEGEIFGLLGPNGAGKTTLIKILLSITFPTSGTAKVFGSDASEHKWKSRTGYLPENHKFPGYLTGEQVLNYYSRLSGMKSGIELHKKIKEMLELMKLSEWRNTKIRKYSKGMMQKLGLAQALMSGPDLVFLDEPTDGVDPIGRKEIRDILLGLKANGKTVFLNSHLLSEVEMICDRVAILNKGDLIKEGNVDDLTKTENIYIIETTEPIGIETKRKILSLDQNAGIGETEIHTEAGIEKVNVAIDILRKAKIQIRTVNQKTNTLEELFINVIKKDEDAN
ncbi:MAG: ABC transporter ATP-binding protein [Ignavibacteria bacterium]|jgi:ABC-2 type transport system ATP-binding protein